MPTEPAVWSLDAVYDRPGTELYVINLTFRAHQVDGQWAAYCEEFAVHSCGDDLDEALDNALDATLGYLNTIEALGERKRVFAERGVEARLHLPTHDQPTAAQVSVRTGEVVQRVAAFEVVPTG